MTKPTSKPASAFLQTGSGDLQTLLAKVKLLNDLNTALNPYLDAHIKGFCQVANLVDKELILIAANGSIATQIRFQTADLLRQFKNDPLLKNIQSIHCKVRPSKSAPYQTTSETTRMKMQPLSQETANYMLETAQFIEDKVVRNALEKLARNTKKD